MRFQLLKLDCLNALLLLFISMNSHFFLLSAYRDKKIVNSFRARPFVPPSGWLASNPHYQTIIGSEALRLKLVGSYPRSFRTKRERVYTLDEDFFDVDFTSNCFEEEESNTSSSSSSSRKEEEGSIHSVDGCRKKKPMVLILHGLESNSEGPLVTKMTSSFLNKGFCCCLVSFRSCSGEENRTPGAYHLGFTKDVDFLVKTVIRKRFPGRDIYLSGFSLGGNVVLKYLGELGDQAIENRVAGAVVTCVPFDPVASQCKLDTGFNRAVYSMVLFYSLYIQYYNSSL